MFQTFGDPYIYVVNKNNINLKFLNKKNKGIFEKNCARHCALNKNVSSFGTQQIFPLASQNCLWKYFQTPK